MYSRIRSISQTPSFLTSQKLKPSKLARVISSFQQNFESALSGHPRGTGKCLLNGGWPLDGGLS